MTVRHRTQVVAEELQRLAHEPSARPASTNDLKGSPQRTGKAYRPAVVAKSKVGRQPLTMKAARRDQRFSKASREGWIAAAIGAALVAVTISLWASGVFRVRTPDGMLRVEVNEPHPDVYVDGTKMTVTWDKGGKKAEIRVKPGTRKVEVKKDGFTAVGEEVELEDGGRRVFTAKSTELRRRQPSPADKDCNDTPSGCGTPRPASRQDFSRRTGGCRRRRSEQGTGKPRRRAR